VLDDARLRLLGEMGIDVYVPRAVRSVHGSTKASGPVNAAGSASTVARTRVALVARVQEGSEAALLAQVQRALAFAGLDGVIGDAAGVIGEALGLIVFGKALAREVGAALPADRAKHVHWISAADVASIVGNADAKRALWSELRRMIRTLGSR
jgi:hypothetical protein